MKNMHVLVDYDHGCSGEFLTKEIGSLLGIDVPYYSLNGRTKVRDIYAQELLKTNPNQDILVKTYQLVKDKEIITLSHRTSWLYYTCTKHYNLKVLRITPPVKYRQHVIESSLRKVWFSRLSSPIELKGLLEASNIPLTAIGNLTHKNTLYEFIKKIYGVVDKAGCVKLIEGELTKLFDTTYEVPLPVDTLYVPYDELMFDGTAQAVCAVGEWLGCDLQGLTGTIQQHIEIDKKCNEEFRDWI